MAKTQKKLPIACTDSNCASGLHCFRATKEMVEQKQAGVCRACGTNLIDWPRVHQRALNDVANTFSSLKKEYVRHYFWHLGLGQRAVNHARRKGKDALRGSLRHHLETAIGPAQPFRDGYQTPMPAPEDATSLYPYAQHATATCCRTCLEYWHGIPKGRALCEEELQYCTELACLYIEDRIPEITKEGEAIPSLRRNSAIDSAGQ
jgi:hypothetical protein